MNRKQRREAQQAQQAQAAASDRFYTRMQDAKRAKALLPRLSVKRVPVFPTATSLALVARWQRSKEAALRKALRAAAVQH